MHGDPFVMLLAAIAGVAVFAAIILETAIGFSRGKKLSHAAYSPDDSPGRTNGPTS